LAAAAGSEEKSQSAADDTPFEFTHFLRDRPLELGELLGKHFSEVVPQEVWGSLPSPEEYKNPAIKYGVYARSDLHEYMKFCADETPIFTMIARILGGGISAKLDHEELTEYTEKYVMRATTGTGEHNADLSWDLRGGPSSPNF
jgi:hypothetical protein